MILFILLFLYVGANTFELQETCTLTLTHASNEIDCTSNFDTCNNISSCLAYLRTTGSETCTFLCSETTSLCTISNYVLSQGASSIYTKDRTSCEEFKTTSNNNSDSAEIYKLSDWQIIFVWIFLIAISIGLCGGFLLRVTPDEHLPEFLQKEKQRMNLTARLDRRHTVMTLLEEKSRCDDEDSSGDEGITTPGAGSSFSEIPKAQAQVIERHTVSIIDAVDDSWQLDEHGGTPRGSFTPRGGLASSWNRGFSLALVGKKEQSKRFLQEFAPNNPWDHTPDQSIHE